jgi:hypothetical protein
MISKGNPALWVLSFLSSRNSRMKRTVLARRAKVSRELFKSTACLLLYSVQVSLNRCYDLNNQILKIAFNLIGDSQVCIRLGGNALER